MITNLPWYVPLTIILVNIIFFLFWIVNFSIALRRLNRSNARTIILIASGLELAWLALQAILAYTGFYLNFDSMPPRFLLAIVPPVLLIIVLLSMARTRVVLDAIPLSSLTYLHAIRIPVELVVWALFLNGQLPELMTFAGKNLDILVGLTAPIVGYLCFTKKILSRRFALIWHLIGLAFLVNVTALFVLSVPSPFQVFTVEQPNVGFFYFPFIWAPSHGVPSVVFAHCIAIRRLWKTSAS